MASETPGKASILRLPPEILMLVIGSGSRKDYFNVALVCRAFNSAVVPLLYRKLSFCLGDGGRVFEQLEFTHQANPSLLKHCRYLRLYTTPHCLSCDHKFLRITSLIGAMSKVKTLSFLYNGRAEPGALCRLILDAFHRMPGLKLFRLQCSLPSLDLQKIMSALDGMPSLRVLSLWGVNPRYPDTNEGDSILTTAMHQTAPITSLRLMCDNLRAEDLEQFIKWPKTLTRFRLVGGIQSEPVADLPTLGNWLSIHKTTLRSIRIGSLALTTRGQLLDLTAFTSLETFSVQPQVICLPGGEFPYHDVHLLLGPKLHTFTLEHPLCAYQIDFGDVEEQWIRNLAKTATRLKSALRWINIIWHVDDDNFGCLQDRIDRLNRQTQVEVGMEHLGVAEYTGMD